MLAPEPGYFAPTAFGLENSGRNLRLYLGGRKALSCWIRTFLLLFVITFLWVQFTFGNFFWIKNSSKKPILKYDQTSDEMLISVKNNSYYEDPLDDNNIEIESKDNINIDHVFITIRKKIKKYNEEQNVINEETYGPLSNDSLVIVIQVHNRIIYLKYLIESLSKTKKINESLLVFSHDVYDSDINMLIQSITFCKVMQIFLPYSIEAYPDEFPGNDPNDCPRDIGKQRALKTKCQGAENPDKYGHYRESKFTQIKHHWWWKANQLFNHLNVTKSFTGLVTFLEEDHYVAEDFIYLLKMMNQKCSETADCFFLGLGFHVVLTSYKELKDADQVKMNPLTTNLGLSFNRTTFNILLSCSKQFCEYDDYNWDWSLNYIAQTCRDTELRSMIACGPRIIHTGECGTHVHKKDCKENIVISKIQDLFNNANDKLYPSTITVNDLHAKSTKIKENGGWGDKRDHELCINMTRR